MKKLKLYLDEPSEALKEVWEWKEAVYLDIKDMGIDKGIQYILERSHILAEQNRKNVLT